MSRRADPARIEVARRNATRNRLIGERVTEATADAWIAAWDDQAAHGYRESPGSAPRTCDDIDSRVQGK
jgi:hypothetical protein